MRLNFARDGFGVLEIAVVAVLFAGFLFIWRKNRILGWVIIGAIAAYLFYEVADWNYLKQYFMVQWSFNKYL